MSFTWIDLIGHLSFALTAISFYLRDILLLRLLAIASGLIGIVFNILIPNGPIWLVVFWLAVFIFINAQRVLVLLWERRDLKLTEEEQELFETVFRSFSPYEFLKVMRVAKWVEYKAAEVVTTEGKPVDSLHLIYHGAVSIRKEGSDIGEARDGAMIGEMSFLSGGNANADVKTIVPTKFVKWEKQDLRALLKRNPSLEIVFQTIFATDLAKKLAAVHGTSKSSQKEIFQ